MLHPNNKKIGIVIVTYNNLSNTLCALGSVLDSDYDNKDIVIVDNCSEQIYKEKLESLCKERFPSIEILYLKKQHGYGGACNAAAEYLAGRNIDAFLFLNNDVMLRQNCILKLVANLKESNVLIGPKVYFGFSNKIYSAGGFFNKTFMIVHNRGNGKVDEGQYDKKEQVEFINGCAFLISAKMFNELKGFDESFYYYSEESDLCYRIVNAGYNILYEPEAVAHHWVSATFGNETRKSIYYKVRSHLYFSRKHSKNNIIFLNHCLYLFCKYFIKLSTQRLIYILTRAMVVLTAVKDFITKKSGAGPYG